jgi:hypothetical protein
MTNEHGTIIYALEGADTDITTVQQHGTKVKNNFTKGKTGCIKKADTIARDNTQISLQITNNDDEQAIIIFGRSNAQLEEQQYYCKYENCTNEHCGYLHNKNKRGHKIPQETKQKWPKANPPKKEENI